MAAIPLYAYGLSTVVGILSHVLYFNRGEHHLHGTRYLQLLLLSSALTTFLLTRLALLPLPTALANTALFTTTYLAGAIASLLTYRAFVHPLRHIPGPALARLTSFWLPLHVGPSQAYKTVHKLHQTYGPYVRVGTNEVSIAKPDAVPLIYGYGTKCTKAPWYDSDWPLTSMHTSRDRAYHDARRRVWGGAFNDRAVRGYEGRVQAYSTGLVARLREFGGGAVDVSRWFNYFSYDVMGDLAFGKAFGMLRTGEGHFAVELLNEGMQPFALMLPTWAFRMLAAIPGAAKGYWKFIKYCSDQLEERMRTKPEVPDIMSALVEPLKDKELTERELNMLQADSRLVIVAGSDTTAATLTHIFYHLAASPHHQDLLRRELAPHLPADGSPPAHRAIHDLPHLNGIINEALRLHPAVPTALQRLTPAGGLQLPDGTFVPGGTVVWCPAYAIGRSAEAYVEPDAFVPERWYEDGRRAWVRCPAAFAPFSAGVYGCVGRPLALMELRLVVAKIVGAFEVALAEGEAGERLLGASRDHFTFECGALRLCFKERGGA